MEDTTKQKRFYFDREQLVLIGVAFGMAAAIILVLGMITGKTIARRKTAERATPPAKIAVAPPSARIDATLGARPDSDTASTDVGTGDATFPKKEVKSQEKSPKTDNTKIAPPVKEPAQTVPQPPADRFGDRAATASAGQEERPPSKAARKDAADQVWTIQVQSSPDRAFAEKWVDRLKAKGHEAYLIEADVKGQTWYRVRVGQLHTRQEAETMQTALEAQEGLSSTFLFRINKSRTPD